MLRKNWFAVVFCTALSGIAPASADASKNRHSDVVACNSAVHFRPICHLDGSLTAEFFQCHKTGKMHTLDTENPEQSWLTIMGKRTHSVISLNSTDYNTTGSNLTDLLDEFTLYSIRKGHYRDTNLSRKEIERGQFALSHPKLFCSKRGLKI